MSRTTFGLARVFLEKNRPTNPVLLAIKGLRLAGVVETAGKAPFKKEFGFNGGIILG
jgi:hypothetical protein